ncbi:MurR/RpiR family transcriptional regulator [Asticcacaulis sp. EMRT-3]|uniref:MurR/RpiR family transcriptional regulator n=1 Tax=Asticcacaulis sp. EMRT-3 TaxID=3040349 RepID=UPI0024AF3BE5|nr:MurR/RpiR family transcriptional regulator [Asticcacaulis sp. EMRT-3]MDI7775755.1 MurR/RpiR family transcriptional regulator [Asticcacaulis sp. EMRT-3]
MATLNDILTTIRDRAPHEDGVNLKIGEEILRDPGSVVDVSIKSFANRVGVSEPSVIRYCRSIGCEGFKEFKKYLAQSLVLEQKFARETPAGLSADGALGDERFDRVSLSVATALRSVSGTRHFERIDAAARVLMSSQMIAVFGLGGSSAVLAMEGQNRLFRLGLRAVAHVDSYMQRMTAATLKKGDTVLFVSSTGQPEPLAESARIARNYGATCIAMAPENSQLAGLVDILIPIELAMDIPYHQPNPVRFAQMFVLDCIADRVALMIGKPAVETLRRVSSAVSPQQHYLPTGD